MIKKATLLFMFIVFIITVSGCETTKGAIQGAKEDCKGAIQGAQKVCKGTVQVAQKGCKGTVQVAKKGWQSVQEIDAWMQKNLW